MANTGNDSIDANKAIKIDNDSTRGDHNGNTSGGTGFVQLDGALPVLKTEAVDNTASILGPSPWTCGIVIDVALPNFSSEQ